MCDDDHHEKRDTRKRQSEGPYLNPELHSLSLIYDPIRFSTSTTMPIIVQSPTPTEEEGVPSTQPPRSNSRQKSRLERWIEDQHAHPNALESDDITLSQRSSQPPYPNPVYSDMCRARSTSCIGDSGSVSESFVLVDHDDETGRPCRDELKAPPPFGVSTPPSTRSYTSLLRTPPSLRAFRFSFTPSNRASSPSPHDSSPSLFHHSTFQRHSFSMGRHGRTVSDGSFAHAKLQHNPRDPPSTPRSPRSYSPWTFKRPSVLGTFTPPNVPADEGSAFHLSPPRPSFSSTLTFSSGTTGVSTDPCTPNLGTPSPASSSFSKGPRQSLWSLPPDASHLHDPPNAETSVLVKPSSIRLPFSLKTSGKNLHHVPSMLPVSRDRRKKKLVVSGIAKGDQSRLEAVRKWCESFGEVNQFTRMPNGDLHIDFRKAEVADTVCRVNARVHISGVGSVSLSWYTGKRP